MENDGYNDLVSSSYYDGYIAILHQSTITHQLELVALWDVTIGGSANGVVDVFIADMNSDCRKDIVVFDRFNQLVAIFLQTDEYGVFVRTQVNTPDYFDRGGVGDLNHDGFTDLIWTYYADVFIAYRIVATIKPPIVFSLPRTTTRMVGEAVVGDVNGDGKPDLVAVDGYAVLLYIWESPTMELRVMSAPPNVSKDVALGDLDGDGIKDIAVPGAGTGQVVVTWGGVFTTTPLYGGDNLADVAIGDVNDDGKLELIVSDQMGDRLVVWKFAGRNATPQAISAYFLPGQIAIGDLNGDGLNDVAYGLAGHTAPPHAPVTVHYQTGSGFVQPRFDICVYPYQWILPQISK